jgi:uncharacterized protein YcaQ
MPRSRSTLSLAAARRVALAAQGFGADRDAASPDRRALRTMIERLGAVQIDSVNVLARAHTLPGFSRLGCYATADLDALAYAGRRRTLFEYWGHEASYLPVRLHPLLRWRMARASRGEGLYGGLAAFGRDRAALIAEVRREIADRGPLSAAELGHPHKGEGGWWGWSDGKRALEWLFWAGEVTTATRRGAFERVYDLAERALPRAVLDAPTPPEAEAQRALLRIAAEALGVATARCLRDYFRLPAEATKARIAELVEAGELLPVAVEGWRQPACLWHRARVPRRVEARALLAPFDPLIWQRERVEALFGARIRLEIYTPAEKRTHGYYVLPFLLGERIVARLDLKADRAAGVLVVRAAHAEGECTARGMLDPLIAELRLLSRWLDLPAIAVEPRGGLARPLAAHLAPRRR